MTDWTGNANSIYKTLGASNHTDEEREENDYYATDPRALEELLKRETFFNVWEPAAGGGHLVNILKQNNILGRQSDIINRTGETEVLNFFDYSGKWEGDIITNPPYKYAAEFCQKALNTIDDGRKIAMFLKIQFLEGKARRQLFDTNPPKKIYVFTSRILCGKNGVFSGSSAVCYAWFVWEKGNTNNPVIEWI